MGQLTQGKIEHLTLQTEMEVSRQSREVVPSPDMLWIVRNYKRLQSSHSGKWIAVKNLQVVESSTELEKLLGTLTEKYGTTLGFAVEFIGAEPRNLLI